jgi:hypothetical protein
MTSADIVSHTVHDEFGHMSFLWGKDMSYFQTAVDLVKKYDPVAQAQDKTPRTFLS